METRKSISVVLPNYNGKHLMESFLPTTFEALHYSQVEFEFIIVDDCSTDDSVSFLTANYPTVILLENKVNSGFSYTCNQGLKKATKDLVFLLNSDVKLSPSYFESQFAYFNKPNTFGVMGCIMNFDEKKIEDAARLPSYKGAKFKANTFYYLDNSSETLTCYLSGANALVDREKLMLLNGFNEIYSPFYFEDFDLGLRAWKMGWMCYYEHKAVCYHQVSSSTSKMNKSNFVKITYSRNSFILQSTHLNGLKRKIWFLQLFTIILIGHLLKGEFWVFKSIGQFLSKRNEVAKARANIKQLQQQMGANVNLKAIVSIIKQSLNTKKVNWL